MKDAKEMEGIKYHKEKERRLQTKRLRLSLMAGPSVTLESTFLQCMGVGQ
jgi:hypothetical protein